MAISSVWIEDGCVSCGLCEATCPEVFEMPDTAVVRQGVHFSDFEECIREAAEGCPVEVIKFKE